jgi:hypothetical protein
MFAILTRLRTSLAGLLRFRGRHARFVLHEEAQPVRIAGVGPVAQPDRAAVS